MPHNILFTDKMKLVEMQRFLVSKNLNATATSKLNETSELPSANVTVTFGTKKNIIIHNANLKQKVNFL